MTPATLFTTAVFCLAATCTHAQGLFTAMGPVNPAEGPVPPLTLGTIAGVSGFRIHIIELGAGGDCSTNSGPVTFSALGSGMSFSWSAGQRTNGATYSLDGAPEIGVFGARGFVYQQVSEWADDGASVDIRWHGNEDADGYRTYGNDKLGNFYDDPGDSSRAWVRYELVAVPEPSTSLMALAGAVVFWAASRRARSGLRRER
jgi:hypothetical protein